LLLLVVVGVSMLGVGLCTKPYAMLSPLLLALGQATHMAYPHTFAAG